MTVAVFCINTYTVKRADNMNSMKIALREIFLICSHYFLFYVKVKSHLQRRTRQTSK